MAEFHNPQAVSAHNAALQIKAQLAGIFDVFDSDPGVTEVALVGEQTWLTRLGRRELGAPHGQHEVALLSVLRMLAGIQGNDAYDNDKSAFVYAKLEGYRFTGSMAPVSASGNSLTIRKHSPKLIPLSDYVANGLMPQRVADLLRVSVEKGKNILVAGGTDSGKTTLLNSLAMHIPKDELVATVEDPRELRIDTPFLLPFEYNNQTGQTAKLCIEHLMRRSPDRIIQGELKDGAAAAFLEAANTGHHGLMTTLHANSDEHGLTRLELLALRGGDGIPQQEIAQRISGTIDYVVHAEKRNGKRRITSVAQVDEYDLTARRYRVSRLFHADSQE